MIHDESGSGWPRAPVLTLVALALLPRPALGQSDAPPCRVAELDSLAFMIGDWSVRSRTRNQAGEWVETPARATIRTRLSGCLIEEIWEGELNGRGYRSVAWLAYDRRDERWQRAVVDDAHGSLLTAQGRWKDGRLRLFVSRFRDGRLLLDRTTITPVDSRGFEWELESSYDGGESWRTVWTRRHERLEDD